jgi:hypothetical protein
MISQSNLIENCLNLLWLLFALGSLVFWWAPWSAQERKNKNTLLSLGGLSCVLLLLFPVISLTDDLQEIQALAEYAGSSTRLVSCSRRALASFDSSKESHPFVVSLDFAPLISFPAAFQGQVLLGGAPSPASAPRRPVQGRAPPR